MIYLVLPDNHQQEREYVAEILLNEILGLHFEVSWENRHDSVIRLKNGNELAIEDHFFNSFHKEGDYLKREYLPAETPFVSKQSNAFIPEKNLPVIFGNDHVEVTENSICCGIDVFAGAFLMLTRWEEYVLPDRDHHMRFPAKASLAYKNNFLHRPIVNEYAEMLWNMLDRLGIGQKRKNRKPQILLTHDVDIPRLWPNVFLFFKKIGGDLVKRRDWKEVLFSFKSYFKTISGKTKDPYDTFDYLMDLSEKNGLRSHFFFHERR